ncbi:MAG: hypothetical protein ACPG4T_20125, partial [Nannocystaceae bacterium]
MMACTAEGGPESETEVSTGEDTTTGETEASTGSESDSDGSGLDADGPVLSELDAFQVVAIPLVDGGVEVPVAQRPAPIVAGRGVMLRAKVEVPPEWETQEVEFLVDVAPDGGSVYLQYSTTSEVAGSS